MEIKICRSCGAENSPNDLECRECMSDISGIAPTERAEEKPVPNEGRLLLAAIPAGGGNLPVSDGDILGRDFAGKDLFAAYGTVSRRHAKITRISGEWAIEDMDSTNGTYVNGSRLEAGQKRPLKANDIVALSKSCEFLVEIEE